MKAYPSRWEFEVDATHGEFAQCKDFHTNFQNLNANNIITGTYCSDWILLSMDKESLLCGTVSSKHLLTAQLQYNLVALTLIFRDSRPFVLIPKQVTCLSVIVHFIVSTWFLWPVLIIQLPEASQPATPQSVLSFSPHMQVIPMPFVFYTGNYNQIDCFLCCFHFIWDLLSETNN